MELHSYVKLFQFKTKIDSALQVVTPRVCNPNRDNRQYFLLFSFIRFIVLLAAALLFHIVLGALRVTNTKKCAFSINTNISRVENEFHVLRQSEYF